MPLDTLPGSTTAAGILDLWSHPLLQDKWKPIVRRIEFTSQALEVVQTGAVAPISSPRTLMVATVSASAPFEPPSILSVALPLFEVDRSHGIRVDCFITDLMGVRRSLAMALASRSLRWTDPVRSPGSTAAAARVHFTGYFPPGGISPLDLSMLIQRLRNLYLPRTVLLASEAVFADNSAMILELSDPAAALSVVSLCDEMAFVSQKVLTIRTLATTAVWEDRLEAIFTEDPASFISKLRWRKSRNGGRTVAQPAATQRQLQASRRVAAVSAVEAPPPIAEVVVQGSVGHSGRQVELQIIRVLEGLGMSLRELSAATPSEAGSWQSVAGDTSAGPSGRLRLHLSSDAELQTVRTALHDKAFQLGSDLISLTVSDDASLAQQAKNGRRGARRRAGPPGSASSA